MYGKKEKKKKKNVVFLLQSPEHTTLPHVSSVNILCEETFTLFSRDHDILRTYLPGAKNHIFFPSCTVHGIKSQDFHVRSQSILFCRETSTSFRTCETLPWMWDVRLVWSPWSPCDSKNRENICISYHQPKCCSHYCHEYIGLKR